VKVLGAGELEPLLLISGLPEASLALEPLMRTLGATRTLFAIDTSKTLGAERNGATLAQALDALAVDGFHLYADRSGAAIAKALAAALPQRCLSLLVDGRDAPSESEAATVAAEVSVAVMNPSRDIGQAAAT
jgi:pimeloyl-ACP methyl ester carboxylesterase